jgi:FAD/FMN-containing dehydrogenase
VECSATGRPELYEAQRLSLGLLGVAVEVEMAVLPAYHLEERVEKKPLAEVLERFPEWAAQSRHAEFFVFPYGDQVALKTLHPASDEGTFKAAGPVDETVWRLACELGAAAPSFIPTLQKLLTRGAGKSRRVGPAHRIFPSERTVRFEEMEYELPREAGLVTLKETLDWIRRRELPVAFPFEFRWTAGDDLLLSPFSQGPCASVSMHQFAPMPWRALFEEAEAVFRAAGGRPHWGKRHALDRAAVDALYPQAERFRETRRAHDPEGKFLNAHLAPLFS